MAGVLLKAAADDAGVVGGQICPALADGLGCVTQNGRDKLCGGATGEWLVAGGHLVEHNAEGEDVGAVVEQAAGDLFRRHVGRSAHDRAFLGVAQCSARGVVGTCLADILGEAEVEYFDAAFVGDHHVGGLEVAMDNALVVSSGERIGECAGNLENLLHRQAASADDAVERLALDQFHGEEVDVAGLFDGIDGNDVGMIERSYSAGFTLKTSQAVLILRHGRREHLDGNVTAEAGVAGAKDLAHPACSDRAEDLVLAEFVAWG